MKKRILVISWFFPPVNSSEGLVTYKLLNNSKYSYDVYTQNSNFNWAYETADDLIIGENIARIFSKSNNIKDFYLDAISFFKSNIDKYDVIMTRSMPEISHEIGLKIKELNPNIIWISSFGDPIANNPFTIASLAYNNPYGLTLNHGLKRAISPFRILKSFLYKVRYRNNYKEYVVKNNKLQREIINRCNIVIYNSIEQKEYMLKDYNNRELLDQKSLILPHTYDENLYSFKKNKNAKLVFSFIGHLDDIRTPHTLFEAIKRLKEHNPFISEKVEFNFYGDMSDREKLFLLDNELIDLVKIRKPVDYLTSLKIMVSSDWLIHIDANISSVCETNIFFAAKIADYIGAKSNIIGITMLNGPSADILRNYNALCLENCVDEIFNYLYLIIYNSYKISLNYDYREEFNAKQVSKKFDEFLDKIIKE